MKKLTLKMFKTLGYEITKIDGKDTYASRKHRILKTLVSATNPVIFDVGAHVGESVIEFQNTIPNSSIHSFEPDPDTYETLKYNTKECKNVFLNNLGITNAENVGNTLFYKHSHSKLNSLNKINIEGKTIQTHLKSKRNDPANNLTSLYNRNILVDLTTLDLYCKENNIRTIDLLKLDTQGHERECLEGAGDILNRTKVIYTEIMFFDMYEISYNFYDIEKLIVPKGFSLYSIPRSHNEKQSDKIGWVEAIYCNLNYFSL